MPFLERFQERRIVESRRDPVGHLPQNLVYGIIHSPPEDSMEGWRPKEILLLIAGTCVVGRRQILPLIYLSLLRTQLV
jgi:hypothetical protein